MTSIEAQLAAAMTTVQQFVEAVAAGAQEQAQALCTERGWDGGDDRVNGLVRQAQRKGLVLDPMGEPHKLARRAAQLVVLSHPARPRPLGDLWLLLEEVNAGWRIVGATKIRAHAALFLWGALGGALSVVDLDRSERGDALAETLHGSLQTGVVPELPFGSELLAKRLEGDAVSVEVLRSVELLAVSRAAVGFRFTTPTDALGHEVWLVLSLSTAVPAVVAATPFLGLELLFTGVDVSWPHEDPDRPGKAIPAYEDPANPEGARLALEGMLRGVLVGAGVDPGGLPHDDPRRAAIGELFANLRRIAPRHGESLLDTRIEAAAEALQPNPDAPIPLGLPADVQERLELALASIQERTPSSSSASGQLDEAAALLRTQGAELVSAMVQSLLKEVNPRGVELTRLEASEGPDGGPILRAIVDPAALLGDIGEGFDTD